MIDLIIECITGMCLGIIVFMVLKALKKLCFIADKWLEDMQHKLERDKKENEARLFEKARLTLNNIVYSAVEAMEQLKARDIRKAVKAGIKDKAELNVLAIDVLEQVKESITPRLEKELSEYIVDIDDYIKLLIESSLHNIKVLEPVELYTEQDLISQKVSEDRSEA